MPAAPPDPASPEFPNFQASSGRSGVAMFSPLPPDLQPAIWVRKLSVWRHWSPEENRVMRTLNLRRGLNILWARSSSDDVASPRIGGHGAGKTTFCRLLRYLLDEKQPGTSEFRQDFRSSW